MTGLPTTTRLLRWLADQGARGAARPDALLWLKRRGLGHADAETEIERALASGEAYEDRGLLLSRSASQPEPPPDEEPEVEAPPTKPAADLVTALLAMSEADWHAVACARVEVRKARSRMAKASAAERRARDKIAELLAKEPKP